MNTTTKSKSVTCNRCQTGGLQWKKSKRTNGWYLVESVRVRGYSGRVFTNEVLHRCPPRLSTEPTHQSVTVCGRPEGPVENPETHVHRMLPWRPQPGSTVHGHWCQGCRYLLVD